MFFSSLIDFIFPPRKDKRVERETTEETIVSVLAPTFVEVTSPPTTALLPFRNKTVRALIHEAKYQENTRAQMLLAAVLSEYLMEMSADLYERAVVIPMPLSSERKRERGFNQCELLAKRALVNFPERTIALTTNMLKRVKNTEHQTHLSQTLRKDNMKNAFTAQEVDAYTTYILFDDVITTGATMQSAIDTLIKVGATHVLPLALAH